MENLPHIIGVHSGFPATTADQQNITAALLSRWHDQDLHPGIVKKFHNSAQVQQRHFALPMTDYFNQKTFAERNTAYIEVALDLGEKVLSGLFSKYNLAPQDISLIISTTVTGLAVPSLEARLMNRLPFSPHVKRLPIFGLGCVAGAAGIARAADYLMGHPKELAVLLSIELCSLTFQDDDISIANMVSSGLFGDGSAAVLLAGGLRERSGGPMVLESKSFFFPNSERVMGFDINDNGFKIVLSGEVPSIAKKNIPPAVDEMLSRHHLHRNDIAAWIAHPGGPKVMEALIAGLSLPPDALQFSYESLREVGNLSSASVLLVLEKTLAHRTFRKGDHAILLAMGPAFCAEVVLLKW